jgi:Type I phosphodiesterase / nucleotide pyrophosphatase
MPRDRGYTAQVVVPGQVRDPSRPVIPKRLLLFALALGLIVTSAVTLPRGSAHAQSDDQDLIDLACSIPHQYLLRTWRGWRADRGAQLSYIPLEPNFVGSGLPHVGPWGYVEDVPMLWYGPGFINVGKDIKRPVTLAGIAPTVADLLKFDGFKAIDGQPMTEAIRKVAATPKLVVTMVWDAGGRNVLDYWPDSHPYLDSLIPKGTWYDDASVGSSPTSTAQDHATIGTGDFPNHNGIVGHHLEIGGKLTSPWNDGPAFLIEPTLADIYDRAMGNEPVVGIVGTVDIHFGMLGHGSFFTGGDRDIALTRSVIGGTTLTDEGFEWNLPPRELAYYKLPKYANDVPGFADDVRRVDQADGKLDGMWRGNSIDQLLKGFDTPARTPYQERVIETVIKNEGFGKDAVPDLLYLNFKEIDYISHVWSMNSLEMRDAVVAQDLALKRFVSFLNQQVGKGNWVLALTADHGAMPDPAVSGGFQISTAPIEAGINAKFDTNGGDTPVVDLVQPSQVFLNVDELTKNGFTVGDVARYIMTLTQAQSAGPGATVDPATANDRVFQAAFPSALMQDLPCLPEARQ